MALQLTSRQLLSSFWQEYHDCGPIALIKAAMDRYSVFGVFASFAQDEKGYRIKLRNGKKFTVTHSRFKETRKKIRLGFKRSGQLTKPLPPFSLSFKEMVFVYYVVFVRMAKQIDGIDIFEEGVNTDYAWAYLGLRKPIIRKMKETKLSNLKKKGLVVYNWDHTMAASGGLYDEYGSVRKMAIPTHVEGKRIKWWYQLR